MATPNHTGTSHSLFILLGIPGLEDQHTWISLPFFISYLVAVLGNCLLFFIIIIEHSLHEPMYFFLIMLAVADLILSTTTVPKALAIFWFHAGEISLDGCVTQIFFIHASFIAESGILLAMAFDRYVAICDPLRYTTVLSHTVIIRVGLAVVLRSFSVILPDVFLVKRLPFCHSNVLPHTYCEHMAVAKFACADIHVNVWYGLSVLLSTVVIDALLILVSYTFILSAVFCLPSRGARQKALGTCGSHLGVISMFYLPGIFTIITQRFGHHVPLHTHILLANVCMLAPPMLNPIIYGIKTRQIRERLVSTLSSWWTYC
ncbi:Olfactory receptor 52B4 [Camelus dromedarius]|uniref:Olfactory receptor n=1 Tax=Camelus dromedarius TaxID=9838 RepID=A0A5N4DLF3_CAMDR|nr:olfactory receptor 52B4-like [Camelus dromedarius]KAB1271897.1 Olfactory receptor 52B4 [Camelus dromedarius]